MRLVAVPLLSLGAAATARPTSALESSRASVDYGSTLAVVQARPVQEGRTTGPSLVLDHVTVIDVEYGRRLRDQRVVIIGNRIRALGSARVERVPTGARVIDARGKYLIPGLWDVHTHSDAVNTALPETITGPGKYQVAQGRYYQFLANGVTGLRDAGSAIPLDTFRVWKRELAAGRRVGPRLLVSGPIFNVPGPAAGCTQATRLTCGGPPQFVYAATVAQGRRLVDSLQRAGADMIKLRELPRPLWLALAAEARRVGLPFGGHFSPKFDSLPATVDGLVASDSGARILDHYLWLATPACGSGRDTVLSLSRCVAVSRRLRQNNTWVTLLAEDLDLPHGTARAVFLDRASHEAGPADAFKRGQAETWRLPPVAASQSWPSAAALAATLSDSTTREACRHVVLAYAADLPVVPGVDNEIAPGVGVHWFLLTKVLCGVPPLWALQTATLNAARALGVADSLGTVAQGKVADLVLLDGDPLDDMVTVFRFGIAGVVANGRYFDRAALARLLREAARVLQAEQHERYAAMKAAGLIAR